VSLCLAPGGTASGKLTAVDVEPAQIDRESLRERIESGADFVLVDALPPVTYAMGHLPGAINISSDWIDDRARRRIPDLDTEVVVYCADEGCDSSVIVASRLVELGYRNVLHYADGKRDWVAAGLTLEGGRVQPRS
jgi:rhodanese-related sulfurtransferase